MMHERNALMRRAMPATRKLALTLCAAFGFLGLNAPAEAGATYETLVNGADGIRSAAAIPSTKNGYKTLFRFSGADNGSGPFDTVFRDTSGNLYGTTIFGGTHGDGTIFELSPSVGGKGKWSETVLYNFTGGSDGEQPQSFPSLIMDKNGNLYGTASAGGALGQGTVFKLAPDGTFTTLYTFKGGDDGATPYSGVIVDKNGNLYGTTGAGGSTGCGGGGCGIVWELAPDGTETVLHSFGAGTDGQNPQSGLLMDKKNGNLYGTTAFGGEVGVGTVFGVKPDGTEKVVYSFQSGSDGAEPYDYLIEDGAGNLYGTTVLGGNGAQGTVFELATAGGSWTESVLYAFKAGENDGGQPTGGLIMDAQGNLYGTNQGGGGTGCGGGGCGGVFELRPPTQKRKHWEEKVLHFFQGIPDGGLPTESVIADGEGTLYGTTASGGEGDCFGGYGCGTVYKLKQ